MGAAISVGQLLENEISALVDLPPRDRAARFRELAHEAKCSAAHTQGTQRQAFIESAGIWQRLANLAEQEIAVDKVFERSPNE